MEGDGRGVGWKRVEGWRDKMGNGRDKRDTRGKETADVISMLEKLGHHRFAPLP